MSEREQAAARGEQFPAEARSAPHAWGARRIAVGAGLFLAITVTAAAIASEVKPAPAPVYRIVSVSMEPTLAIGEEVHVDASAYLSEPPRVGEIVAFHAPVGATGANPVCAAVHAASEACPRSTPVESDQIFVKRIVAGPDETVAVLNGLVVRDGTLQDEPFASACYRGAGCNLPAAITVPPGEWFLMGDNREVSDDSRYWGPVPRSWILGRVLG